MEIRLLSIYLLFIHTFHLTRPNTTYKLQRPLYIIGHMANTVKQVDDFIRRGANAIEADVTFAANGTAIMTFHGYPCDCFRRCSEKQDIDHFLAHIRTLTEVDNPNFEADLTLLLLDLKLTKLDDRSKAIAAEDLAYKLVRNLFSKSSLSRPLNVVLGIQNVGDVEFVRAFQEFISYHNLEKLRKFIGWDVGLGGDFDDILDLWKVTQVGGNIWQGDGITNCLSPIYSLERLASALRLRDEQNTIKKVYHWTIDLTNNIQLSLRQSIDGIITNHPERVRQIIKEQPFISRYRVATKEDSPWNRVITPPVGREVAMSKNPDEQLTNGIKDVVSSLQSYIGEFVNNDTPEENTNTTL